MLKSAQILRGEGSGSTKNASTTISIIDLGFGCGDQCLYFQDIFDKQRAQSASDPLRSYLRTYVGITLESSHLRIAQERLGLGQPGTKSQFQIFCGDAGRPMSWSQEIRRSISSACQTDDGDGNHENWLLGLDTLYHFQPSRWPVIEYANRNLRASVMAFDLCIAENLSVWQRSILRLMAFFGQSPWSNWATIQQYKERLVVAGYAREKIEVHDISEHVFGPLSGFMDAREDQAKQYGLSIGRYRYAAKMFAWWARMGIVRGCIIIARR